MVMEETVVALEAKVEDATEVMVEDQKRTRKRRTNLTHTEETEVEEDDRQVSTIFNIILAKSMLIMHYSVIIMKKEVDEKKRREKRL
jgi:hypothetical protein